MKKSELQKISIDLHCNAIYQIEDLKNDHDCFLANPLLEKSEIIIKLDKKNSNSIAILTSVKALHFFEKIYGEKSLSQKVLFCGVNFLGEKLHIVVNFNQRYVDLNDDASYSFNRFYDLLDEYHDEKESDDFKVYSLKHHEKNLIVFYPSLSFKIASFVYGLENEIKSYHDHIKANSQKLNANQIDHCKDQIEILNHMLENALAYFFKNDDQVCFPVLQEIYFDEMPIENEIVSLARKIYRKI